ncbi:hypothetical protein L3V18_18710 [Lysobacter sp. TLK-CK17T]|uniref:Uncharacterized protein n=2 Tax=Marilutibacter chinensis TaxID=2912247 RepID=A0ABS9HZJ2_9GAMM|nr:hypothetical protein [Lysobacter chinensis]
MLDKTCGNPHFEKFLTNALREFPEGFVRSMYCSFSNGCNIALRTSNLISDLELLFRHVGFKYPEKVRGRERVNVTASRWTELAVAPDELVQQARKIDNLEGLRFPYITERLCPDPVQLGRGGHSHAQWSTSADPAAGEHIGCAR